jgi:hypothetical protein
VAGAERQPAGEVAGVGGPGVALVAEQEGGHEAAHRVGAGTFDARGRVPTSELHGDRITGIIL